jgi:hypothetical protein
LIHLCGVIAGLYVLDGALIEGSNGLANPHSRSPPSLAQFPLFLRLKE